VFLKEGPSLQLSYRCAFRRESHRTLRDGSFEVALSQALRARLRLDRPFGTGGNAPVGQNRRRVALNTYQALLSLEAKAGRFTHKTFLCGFCVLQCETR
jgi:hypothetical protein